MNVLNNYGNFVAIAAENNDLVTFFDCFDEFRETGFGFVHVDGNHLS